MERMHMKKGLIIAIVAVGVVGFIAYNRYKKMHEVAAPVAMEGQAGTFEGATDLKDKTFDTLQIKGDAKLESVQVTNDATITGLLDAKKLNAKQLNVTGNANIDEATVEAANVTGMLNAKGCTIQDLSVTSESSMMDSCKVKKITVKKVEGSEKPQVLELNNSQVEGDVTFEAGNGEVVLKGDARVAGAVVGGAIKQ
jgi:cytoskeletal protein CcmA (bactofilin family)